MKRKASRFVAVSLILCMVAVVSGCASGTSDQPTDQPPAATMDEKPVVALIMKSLANEFFKTMQEGAEAYAAERGDLELKSWGIDNETDVEGQIALVEDAISQKVDAIVIAMIDPQAILPKLKEAVDAGITVITIDVRPDEATMEELGLDLPFIGPDNREGAKLAGDVLGEELGDGGKVFIVEGNPGVPNAEARKQGFMDSIDEYGLELLASETAHWETEEALSLVSDLITAHPDVNGIMCANDSMALGAVQAVEAAGRTGDILVVGFDNISAAQELMREGKLLATVDQFADKQAAKGIEYAMNTLAGESYSGWVKTDVELVLPEDVGGAATTDEKPVVALIMKSLANEFFKTMQEGAEAYAAERGDLELKSWGIDNETDVEGQIALVEDAISQKVDAIVIAMIDPQAILPKLKEAVDAGITVITIDVRPDEATMEELGLDLPFIGPDNREGAKLAGDVLGEELGDGGKVFIVEGNPGVPNAEARKQGFMDSIDEYGLELLASETAHWETEEALSLVSDLITAHPDVNGIMCANDSMALGAVQAVEAAGRTGDILVVGFDNISAAQELMREGKLLATVDQFADKQAAKGIEYAMNTLAGESYSGWVRTDVELVLPEDVK